MYNIKQLLNYTITLFATILLIEAPILTTACSSRTIPRPRPSTSSSISATPLATTNAPRTTIKTTVARTTTTTTPRPNVTFPTYKCPADFDRWYCLNAATCFSIKIGESVMYNCECALGFMGPRCEYKELDGSYLPQRPRPMLEKASIASGATCALIFMFFICLTLYLRYDHQKLKCVNDDTDLLEMMNEFNCRYCYESHYCCNSTSENGNNNATDLLDTAEKYRDSALLRYFENISTMSFAIKRSTKF